MRLAHTEKSFGNMAEVLLTEWSQMIIPLDAISGRCNLLRELRDDRFLRALRDPILLRVPYDSVVNIYPVNPVNPASPFMMCSHYKHFPYLHSRDISTILKEN